MKRALQQVLVATAFVSAACASRSAPLPAASAVHEHEQGMPATAGANFTVADVRFMQDMIGHHAQAIVMAALAPANGASSQVLKLAQKIDISQRDEIGMMKQWLAERKQALPDSTHAHALHMPGMLTEPQMVQLQNARGRDFDRLFLTYMIRHHEGALQMVETLFATPNAAQDSDLFRFVTDVDADQRDEIDQMRHVLDLLAANRGAY